MFLNSINMNSFNFKGTEKAQASPAKVQMGEALNVDTVSFGNAKSKAMQNCIKMTKDIFTELNFINGLPTEKQAEAFLENAKGALVKVKENLASMKEANLPTKEAKVANLKNNEIHAYKLPFMDGYIFEEYTKPPKGDLFGRLLNSIEVSPGLGYVKILHRDFGDNAIKYEAKGCLSAGQDSVKLVCFDE